MKMCRSPSLINAGSSLSTASKCFVDMTPPERNKKNKLIAVILLSDVGIVFYMTHKLAVQRGENHKFIRGFDLTSA